MIKDLFQLHKDIADVISLQLPSVPIVIRNQDNPEFDNYISFKLTNWTQTGTDISGYSNINPSDTSYTTTSIWRVLLSIWCIGNDSEQNALHLAHSLNKLPVLDSFSAIDLAYSRKDPIKFAPRSVVDGWQPRHIVDVYFNTFLTDTDQLEFWDSVEITSEVVGETGTTVVSRVDNIDLN